MEVWFGFPGWLHWATEAPGPGELSAFILSSSVRLVERGERTGVDWSPPSEQSKVQSSTVAQSGTQPAFPPGGDFSVSQRNF